MNKMILGSLIFATILVMSLSVITTALYKMVIVDYEVQLTRQHEEIETIKLALASTETPQPTLEPTLEPTWEWPGINEDEVELLFNHVREGYIISENEAFSLCGSNDSVCWNATFYSNVSTYMNQIEDNFLLYHDDFDSNYFSNVEESFCLKSLNGVGVLVFDEGEDWNIGLNRDPNYRYRELDGKDYIITSEGGACTLYDRLGFPWRWYSMLQVVGFEKDWGQGDSND